MRGAEWWSDHRLLRSKINIQLAQKKKRAQDKPMRKLNVGHLEHDNSALEENNTKALCSFNPENGEMEEQWKIFKENVYTVAAHTLAFVKRKHKDWFDENDAEIDTIISRLHEAHKQHLVDKACCRKKQQYQQAKQRLQQRTRQMENNWWDKIAEDLQLAADMKDFGSFHAGLRAV